MTTTNRGIGETFSTYYNLDEVPAGSGLTVLDNYDISPGVLGRDGDAINFEYFGKFAATGEGSQFIIEVSSSGVMDWAFDYGTGKGWWISGRVVRITAEHLLVRSTMVVESHSSSFLFDVNEAINVDTTPQYITLSALGSQVGDVVKRATYISFFKAPS